MAVSRLDLTRRGAVPCNNDAGTARCYLQPSRWKIVADVPRPCVHPHVVVRDKSRCDEMSGLFPPKIRRVCRCTSALGQGGRDPAWELQLQQHTWTALHRQNQTSTAPQRLAQR